MTQQQAKGGQAGAIAPLQTSKTLQDYRARCQRFMALKKQAVKVLPIALQSSVGHVSVSEGCLVISITLAYHYMSIVRYKAMIESSCRAHDASITSSKIRIGLVGHLPVPAVKALHGNQGKHALARKSWDLLSKTVQHPKLKALYARLVQPKKDER